ncbi:MAG: hypothetical protein JXB88_02775 [Spirochaetales bacterium]|nr:hypothetical protein [Spirochaetales bacterium]
MLEFIKNNILQILNLFLGIGIFSVYLILFNKYKSILIEKYENEIKKIELEKESLRQKTINEKVDTINTFKEYAENINNLLDMEKKKNINLIKEFNATQNIINNIMTDYSKKISDLLIHYDLEYDDLFRLIKIIEYIFQKDNKLSDILIEALSVTLLTAKYQIICQKVLYLLEQLDKNIVVNYVMANYEHISHSNIIFFEKYFKDNWDNSYINIITEKLEAISNREEIIKKPLFDLLQKNNIS